MVELCWRGAVAPSLAAGLVPTAPGLRGDGDGARLRCSGLGTGLSPGIQCTDLVAQPAARQRNETG